MQGQIETFISRLGREGHHCRGKEDGAIGSPTPKARAQQAKVGWSSTHICIFRVLLATIVILQSNVRQMAFDQYPSCMHDDYEIIGDEARSLPANSSDSSDSIEKVKSLWLGQATQSDFVDPHNLPISVVLAFCLGDLAWLRSYLQGFEIQNITIVSKCGLQPKAEHLPEGAVVIQMENVGRSDHTIAHWMTKLVQSEKEAFNTKDEEIILFLKDNLLVHAPGTMRSLATLLNITSSDGFGCALEPKGRSFLHLTDFLTHFHMGGYKGAVKGKNRPQNDYKEAVFKSKHVNMAAWLRDMGISLPRPLTPVCYGGIFAVKKSQIAKVPKHIWSNMESSLARGDNIEEGHFAERTWAGLLHRPLTDAESNKLLAMSRDALHKHGNMRGALTK